MQWLNNINVLCTLMILAITAYFLVSFLRRQMGDRRRTGKQEGFAQQQSDAFLFKTSDDPVELYDGFYADVYDHLVFNNMKNDYEIGQIVKTTQPSSESRILDVGCGTGHHVGAMASGGLDILGIDISPSMIAKAKETYPDYDFAVADAMQSGTFSPNTFTHILCLYFTIYYFPDKPRFFENCYSWLMPGGYLIVHLVDRDNFDPILPPGNPLLFVSPQKYAKQRITSTRVKFTDFDYSADFDLQPRNDTARFVEKFKDDRANKTRKHEHVFYMPDKTAILDDAQAAGFTVLSQIDLLHCQYEYQYLYVLLKPSG